jgi:hypothetical protein
LEYSYTGEQEHYAFVGAQANEDNSPVSVKIIVNGKVKNTGSSESKNVAANASRILYAD